MRSISFIVELIRNIVFLIIGLFSLNFLQQNLIKQVNNFVYMVFLLIADLIILFVIHRQFLAHSSQKLKPKMRNILILISVLIIFMVNILSL